MGHYRRFSGIWNHIDRGNLFKLERADDLELHLNERQQGETPLFLACRREHHDIIEFLLRRGADANAVCRGYTPLILTTIHYDKRSIECLLKFRVDVNACAGVNRTSTLHVATTKGLIDVCQMLIDAGVNVDLQNGKGRTALHIAAQRDHRYIARLLLMNGANVNVLTDDNENVLHIAARRGSVELARLIFSAKQDCSGLVSVADNEGNTALHLAVAYGHLAIAEMIAQRYPRVIQSRNNRGQTPLTIAPNTHRNYFMKLYGAVNTGFLNAFTTKRFADTVVLCSPPIRVHSALLRARCPAMMRNVTENGIVIQAKHSVVDALLYYLYTDSVPLLDQVNRMKLSKLASKLGLEHLQESLSQFGSTKLQVATTFSRDMLQLLNSESHDVTLKIDDAKFHAHKFVLCEQSEFFSAMFNAAMKESTEKEIVLHEFPRTAFAIAMKFLYSGILANAEENLIELFAIANRIMNDSLARACESIIVTAISDSNVISLLALADIYDAPLLSTECSDWILNSFDRFANLAEFDSLSEPRKTMLKNSNQLKTGRPK